MYRVKWGYLTHLISQGRFENLSFVDTEKTIPINNKKLADLLNIAQIFPLSPIVK